MHKNILMNTQNNLLIIISIHIDDLVKRRSWKWFKYTHALCTGQMGLFHMVQEERNIFAC